MPSWDGLLGGAGDSFGISPKRSGCRDFNSLNGFHADRMAWISGSKYLVFMGNEACVFLPSVKESRGGFWTHVLAEGKAVSGLLFECVTRAGKNAA